MISSLGELFKKGVLTALDLELSETLMALTHETRDEIALGVAFASHAVGDGHACVALDELVRRRFFDDAGEPRGDVRLPELSALRAALGGSLLVDREPSGSDAGPTPTPVAGGARPLVLDGDDRLYLRRYFEYEVRLARALRKLAAPVNALDGAVLKASLARLFPGSLPADDRQRRAALLAALSRLVVVSGGPGTGKTYTVAKILVLVVEGMLALGREPKSLLLAPTGKAAQRLVEALRTNLFSLDCDERVRAFMPSEASTIHRALGFLPGTPTRFRHDADNPLSADLVVVNEASMVDLALMTKLAEAIRPDARLVLLGDKDQLASVEAGAILAEIYATGSAGVSSSLAARAREIAGETLPVQDDAARGPLADHLVELDRAHRFEDGGAIAELARAVNAGDADAALACFDRHENLALVEVEDARALEAALAPRVEQGFRALSSGAPHERLALLDTFRVLACHREGAFGVRALNDWAARLFGAAGQGALYDGQPVIVTTNDYQAELYNGDIGVVAPRDASAPSPLTVHFRATQGGIRSLSPARLPEHQPAYALTVHRAQGSEFQEIALVLPSRPSPIVTRELVYTAVTRARRRVTIFGSHAVLRAAIEKRITRASGLAARLRASDRDLVFQARSGRG